jgi:hypothetical protein
MLAILGRVEFAGDRRRDETMISNFQGCPGGSEVITSDEDVDQRQTPRFSHSPQKRNLI